MCVKMKYNYIRKVRETKEKKGVKMTKLKKKIVNVEITRPYLAEKLGLSLSRVSTQINGDTDNLKVKDLKKYAEVINQYIEETQSEEEKVGWTELVD